MTFATCPIRIYVQSKTAESFCPLRIELLSFCEEGKTMDCPHYKHGLKKSLIAQKKALAFFTVKR